MDAVRKPSFLPHDLLVSPTTYTRLPRVVLRLFRPLTPRAPTPTPKQSFV